MKLIIRADDFGASPGTNNAILESIDAGLIKNVGISVPCPHVHYRLDELIARRKVACLGVHVTLNSEWQNLRWGPILPLAQVASLVMEDGTFFPSTNRLSERGILSEILAETEAQLRRLRQLGIEPQYLDTHMVFSWIPGVAEDLAALCERENLVFANGGKFSAIGLDTKLTATVEEILDTVSQIKAGHPVWVFHPAKRDTVSELFYTESDGINHKEAKNREREYQLLTNANFVHSLQIHDQISLAKYPDV